MQPRETEKDVFGHKVVERNGESIIIPSDLDPHMRSRALTLLEAQKIIAALTGRSIEEMQVPEMFKPITVQGPEVTKDVPEVGSDPSLSAQQAASSAHDLSQAFKEFGIAA